MKKFRWLLFPLLLIGLVGCDFPFIDEPDSTVLISNISITDSYLTMNIGDVKQLFYTYSPSDATNSSVTWSSSNIGVASVTNNGIVRALREGTCSIKAMARDGSGVSDTINLEVLAEEIYPTSITVSPKTADVNPGDTYQLSATLTPYNANKNTTITWLSNDTSAATVDSNGLVTVSSDVVNNQTFTITAKTKNQFGNTINDRCVFTVVKENSQENVLLTSVSLSKDSLDLTIGDQTTLTYSYLPTNATNSVVTWSSSNKKVATVTNTGIVTALASGTATIKIKATDSSGVSDSLVVTVSPTKVYPTSISVSPSSLSLGKGASSQLTATILPNDANQNLNVTWESSDTSIATVNSTGYVTIANNANVGDNVNITCKTKNASEEDITATCVVTVIQEEVYSPSYTTLKYTYDDYYENYCYLCGNVSSNGTSKVLVIPVWFTNSSTYIKTTTNKANVLADIKTAFNGTSAETGWESVHSYYSKLSNGKCDLEFTVSDWYNANKSSTNYYSESTGADNTCSLVKTATDYYFSNTNDTRTDYDKNGDGFIDAVCLIYAAPDCATYEARNSDNMWAYTYWLQEENYCSTSKPGPNTFLWASYDFMYSSKYVSSRTGSNYAYNSANCSIDAHTFIHEFGHVMGLDDYYDYGSKGYSPAGGYSMQDYAIGSHDPYSVLAFGWANTYIPTKSCTITLKNFQDSKELILLSPSFNSDLSPFDEYLLLELYTPTSLNEFDTTSANLTDYQGPTSIGIRLWHVDARLVYSFDENFSVNKMTTNPSTTKGYVYHAFSNTYNDSDYGSILGTSYSNYHLLQLVRNDTSMSLNTTKTMVNSDLFTKGSSFSMSKYSKQFSSGKLNKGVALGWSFTVDSLSSNEATITLVKA